MTTNAFSGEAEAVELANRSDLVAGVAVHDSVGADERKAILVLVDVVNGDLPAVGVVT